MDKNSTPYIEIVEQPASKEFRFRYECERRSHGSLLGVNSTLSRKTYPRIKIMGLNTDAHVVVSCVSKEAPYKVHPHRLVSKEKGVNHGVLTITVGPDDNEVELKNLGIQCVRKKDIAKSLEERKAVRVDPFHQGYDHGLRPGLIDLNVVRLCFQVFLFDRSTEKYTTKLNPVVSDPIYDKQSAANLSIFKLSTEVASVAGGTSLVIFGQKIIKEDVKVRFFEIQDDKVVWETSEDLLPRNNHDNQTSITVNTPAYTLRDTDEPVRLMIQLTKPSTGEAGKAIPFTLLSPASFNYTEDKPMDLSSKRKRSAFDVFEPPHISDIQNLNHSGSITPEQEAELSDDPSNILQDRQNVYYNQLELSNQNWSAGGIVSYLSKKQMHSESAVPINSTLSSHSTIHPPLITHPDVSPMMAGSPGYDCHCCPPMLTAHSSLVPFLPHYMYQRPFVGDSLLKIKQSSSIH